MKIIRDFNILSEKGTVITIGNFDGIHIGHKKLITTVKNYALKKGFLSIIVSFSPHPLEVLKKIQPFYYILSEREKDLEIEKEDIDIFIKYPFTENFSQISPQGFINILIEKLNCKVLVVGEDYCFGENRKGNVETLIKIGKEKGITVLRIPDIIVDGKRVSSSRIREFLKSRNIKNANLLLNRAYYILGNVSEGNKLGRTIGFPTANIIPASNKLLPPDGVYITKTKYNGIIYNSITNIGKNPTVNNNSNRTIETFIFDFNGDLYDKEIKVMFLDWIRYIKKFSSINELKEQISKDINIATAFFRIKI